MALTAPSSTLTGQTIAASYDQVLFLDAAAGVTEATLQIVSGTTGKTALSISDEHVLVKGVDTNNAAGFEVQQTDGTSILKVAAGTPSVLVSGSGVKLYFSDAGGEYISGDGTDLTITAGTDLNLSAATDINIPVNVGLRFGDGGENIETDNTSLTITAATVSALVLDANSRISLSNNDSNTGNTVFGYTAFNTSSDNASDNNTVVGHLAMGTGSVAGAIYNTVVGYRAGDDITSGDKSTYIGAWAGDASADVDEAVAIGYAAMGAGTTTDAANGTIAIGADALNALTSGGGNTAIGYRAADAMTDGYNNVALGNGALGGSESGRSMVAVGYGAMGDGNMTTAAVGSVGVGYLALNALTSGAANTAIGYLALSEHLSGEKNTAVGYKSLQYTGGTNSSASNYNVSVGFEAMGGDWSAGADAVSHYNTVVGSKSLSGDLSGANYNTVVGYESAAGLTTGDYNTVIGASANTAAVGSENQTVIGYDADGVANNSVTLGNSAVTDVYMAEDKGAIVHCEDVRIADGGSVGSASEPNAISIESSGRVSVSSTTDDDANFSAFSVNGHCQERPVINVQANSWGDPLGGAGEEFSADGIYGVLKLNVVRAAHVEYNFLTCTSGDNADKELQVTGTGVVTADGSFTGSGADYAEFFESKDGVVIAIGTTVKLDGDKVVACEEGDTPIGVVRPKKVDHKASMTIGNAAWNRWTDHYLTDDFDRYIYEEYFVGDKDKPSTRRKRNPDFVENLDEDGLQIYSPREDRDEWHIIGLLGQIPITKGQPLADNWIKMKDVSDTVEMYFVK
jgi:hypothetical protein